MQGTFSIEIDRFNGILEHKGSGFWTLDTVDAFLAAEREAIASLDVEVQDLLILFDATDLAVQQREVIDRLRQPENPLYRARRAAFVTPRGLGMMQIRRGTPDAHIGVFETVSEARRYLTSD
ncbi:MAG: hypothetical protein DI547_16145 [Sphingobium sp.]|jgi:hypothetical protein|nr:MAG: hypothetical protein DI547_16145 [Sphingobium sp.]